jgi:hypothetical protein
MPYIRQLDSGKWQATAQLPDGKRRSTTRDTHAEARDWGAHTESMTRRVPATISGATLQWTPDGLNIHIPDELITMDMAVGLEDALCRVLDGSERPREVDA